MTDDPVIQLTASKYSRTEVHSNWQQSGNANLHGRDFRIVHTQFIPTSNYGDLLPWPTTAVSLISWAHRTIVHSGKYLWQINKLNPNIQGPQWEESELQTSMEVEG